MFTVTILYDVFTCEVEIIFVVEPDEMEYLYIIPGGNYCTLLTCTPYAANSGRLLVRGALVDGDRVRLEARSDASQVHAMLVAAAIAMPLMAAALAVILVVRYGRRRRS